MDRVVTGKAATARLAMDRVVTVRAATEGKVITVRAARAAGQNPYESQSQYRAYNQPPSPYNQPAGPYGQPGYYGVPAEPKTLSIASMVCGIASVIMGWILLPQIAAIITGHMALKREPTGKGMSITGLVLGYLCLLGYGAFWLLAIIGLAIASTSTSSSYTF
jgi:hypothetical protein